MRRSLGLWTTLRRPFDVSKSMKLTVRPPRCGSLRPVLKSPIRLSTGIPNVAASPGRCRQVCSSRSAVAVCHCRLTVGRSRPRTGKADNRCSKPSSNCRSHQAVYARVSAGRVPSPSWSIRVAPAVRPSTKSAYQACATTWANRCPRSCRSAATALFDSGSNHAPGASAANRCQTSATIGANNRSNGRSLSSMTEARSPRTRHACLSLRSSGSHHVSMLQSPPARSARAASSSSPSHSRRRANNPASSGSTTRRHVCHAASSNVPGGSRRRGAGPVRRSCHERPSRMTRASASMWSASVLTLSSPYSGLPQRHRTGDPQW